MEINYRLIAVWTLTGQPCDIAEYENLADVDTHARALKHENRKSVHVFVVDTHSGHVINRIYE